MNFEAATHRQPVRECREIAKTLHCNIYRENQQSSISSASHLTPIRLTFCTHRLPSHSVSSCWNEEKNSKIVIGACLLSMFGGETKKN